MPVQPNLPNPSFAHESAYESDDEPGTSSSVASTSSSGVILGFDDGEIPSEDGAEDEKKLSVSRLGGQPYFPLAENELPPASLSQCPICSTSMPLLTQIYAPLTDEQVRPLARSHPKNVYREEFDRLLYVFGCTKKGCIGVRLLRAARRNEEWAKEGVENRRLAQEEAQKKEGQRQKDRQVNPFASSSSTDNPFAASNPFSTPAGDFGSMIFGSSEQSESLPSSNNLAPSKEDIKPETQPSGSSEDFANPSTPWPASTCSASFPSRYLNTSLETLSSSYATNSKEAQLAKQLAAMSVSNEGSEDVPEKHKGGRISKTGSNNNKASASSDGGAEGWSGEAYEVMRLSGVEEVFLAFQERLEASGAASQVIRYEFGGTPLPFQAKSKPYQLLYTSVPAPGTSNAVTRAGHSTNPAVAQGVRRYDTTCSKLDRCPHCQSPRTFEMQLMPNLVNILERSLAAGGGEKELGWATVWCFTCSTDCLETRPDDDSKDPIDWQGWREEIALVELEA